MNRSISSIYFLCSMSIFFIWQAHRYLVNVSDAIEEVDRKGYSTSKSERQKVLYQERNQLEKYSNWLLEKNQGNGKRTDDKKRSLLYYLNSMEEEDNKKLGNMTKVAEGAGAAAAKVATTVDDPWSVAAPYIDGSTRDVNDSYDYTKDMRDHRLLSSKGVPVQVLILLGSTARSGTTFIAELLAQQPDGVYYLYEPDLFIRHTTGEMVTEELGMDHLESMMHCNLSSKFVKWLFTRSSASNIVHHDVTKHNCRPWTTCLTQTRLTEACRHEHNRIMKVIRMRVRWLEPFLTKNTEMDVKILNLVRDPRGSLYSMDKNHLKGLDPEYYCPRIADDILYGRTLRENYPHQFMSITYEDFCRDPYGKASEIWHFINGAESILPPQWKSYLEKHTQRKSNSRLPIFGTVRNSSEQYQAWRQAIPEEVLMKIEAACVPVLDLLGYKVFHNISTARDLNVTLFTSKINK